MDLDNGPNIYEYIHIFRIGSNEKKISLILHLDVGSNEDLCAIQRLDVIYVVPNSH